MPQIHRVAKLTQEAKILKPVSEKDSTKARFRWRHIPNSSRRCSISLLSKNEKSHSRRYNVPEFGIGSVVGCDFDVWSETIPLISVL